MSVKSTGDVTGLTKIMQEKSVLSEDGTTRTITQTDYLGAIKDTHSIQPEVFKSLAGAQKDTVSAGMEILSGDLSKLVKEAKARGDDPSDLSVAMKITQPSGPLTINMASHKTFRDPASGNEVHRYGVVGVNHKVKSSIDKEVHGRVAGHFAKLLA